MRHNLRPVVCFLCCLGISAAGADKEIAKPSRKQCDAWVQQLANRSKRPFTEVYVLRPPRNVDRKALADVKAAYDNLSNHFADALPSLISGLADERYSYYQEDPSGAFLCHNVGGACYEIISAHVEVYRHDLTVFDESNIPRTVHFLSEMGEIEKWYDTRKDKSLHELQLEAVDWALKQPRDELIEQAKWDKAIVALKRFRDELAKSKKPFDPKHTLWFEGK